MIDNRLGPYEGAYPETQEEVLEAVSGAVADAGGVLQSRQVLATIRVLTDRIADLEYRLGAWRRDNPGRIGGE